MYIINIMRRIIVQRKPRKYAIIDDADFKQLSQYHWNVAGGKKGSGYYAAHRKGDKPVYMHRLIMDAPEGVEVDHINHNRLDNRRSNLRLCNSHQNKLNMKLRSDNTTGHKGLRWRDDVKSWRVNVKIQGKEIQVGYFKKKRDAIRARKEAEVIYYGEFASRQLT
jgi:hypothetical protein